MRFAPAAAALSLLVAVSASVGYSAPPSALDPRAAALLAQGRAEVAAGRADDAIDAFEAALAVQPGSVAVYLELANATRLQGMQGKALHYYRQALARDPQNPLAIAGEGVALVEKGALEKARRNLARLEQLCGADCAPTRDLAAALAKGPAQRVVTAEQIKPQPVVTTN
ncbi:MAG: tetratricopeptide repeat protein [Novosphingobium sp.]